MTKNLLLLLFLSATLTTSAQNVMTPEILLNLKKVSPIALSDGGGNLYYYLSTPNKEEDKNKTEIKKVDLTSNQESTIATPEDGASLQQVLVKDRLLMIKNDNLVITNSDGVIERTLMTGVGNKTNFKLSPNEKKIAFTERVKYQLVTGADTYNDLPKSNLYIYDDLNYRHWDTWNDGTISHLYCGTLNGDNIENIQDVLKGEPYTVPQDPFGGAEDFVWDPSSRIILYVCKKKTGRAYAESTNTDIYVYSTETMRTDNLSQGMMGYDTNPVFSNTGDKVAWLSMRRDGYEADKNDIVIYDMLSGAKENLTADWDGTCHSIMWSPDDQSIFFTAPTQGTEQVFTVTIDNKTVRQYTEGMHNITSMLGFNGISLVVGKQDMNQATEIYRYSVANKEFQSLTYANTQTYASIKMSKIEKRTVKTVDGKEMLVWVIYPPNYDPNKKYPALLYCQGGPQAQVSQFYSFRWNFQLMAANGYIVMAPNRRGLPGFGVQWNEEISQDWGGKAMKDYMQTSDVLTREIPAIDKDRIGAVGASYGGYSVYMLSGIHNNRYKTFIAHCGLFDLPSWYGTTEELWFANWDLGGSYYHSKNKSYKEFSPSDYVKSWNKPILIYQGGRDYRVPVGQGLQAFQAAQVMGLKSRLIYLPEENHWVLGYQNALAWQREFYRWLKETL